MSKYSCRHKFAYETIAEKGYYEKDNHSAVYQVMFACSLEHLRRRLETKRHTFYKQ